MIKSGKSTKEKKKLCCNTKVYGAMSGNYRVLTTHQTESLNQNNSEIVIIVRHASKVLLLVSEAVSRRVHERCG